MCVSFSRKPEACALGVPSPATDAHASGLRLNDPVPATMGLWTSARVGQTAAHSPHETHVLSPIGTSKSNAMRLACPLPVRPITSFDCTSSQARMHLSHKIHA